MLVKDVDARELGCCAPIFRTGRGVGRLVPMLSFVAELSVVC